MTREELLRLSTNYAFFKPELVNEIKAGRKTRTTRINKPGYKPYKVGDIVYVRETWQRYKVKKPLRAVTNDFKETQYLYKADGDYVNSHGSKVKWRPSIHMPKEAARLFLEITSVRKEHLQDSVYYPVFNGKPTLFPIVLNREGVWKSCSHCLHSTGECSDWLKKKECRLYDEWYELWNSTVDKNDIHLYGFDANPEVYVYEFREIKYDN